MTKITKYGLLALTGVLAAGAATAAAPQSDVPQVVVRYSAQSLATDSGVRALYKRLNSAAREVCPQDSETLWITQAVRECRKQAVEHAVEQIGNSHLAAVSDFELKRG